jgi:hypothetical protein
LAEEILSHQSVQAVSQILTAAFCQIYNVNWEKNIGAERLEKLAVWPEKEHVKLWTRKLWLLRRLVPSKTNQVYFDPGR